MPAPKTGLVAAEPGRAKAPRVPEIASHPTPPRAAPCFQPAALLPGMAGLSLPSAPEPRQPAETVEAEGACLLGHSGGNSLAAL